MRQLFPHLLVSFLIPNNALAFLAPTSSNNKHTTATKVGFLEAKRKHTSLLRAIQMPPLDSEQEEGIDKDLDVIYKQNLAWKASKEAEDPDYFNKLGGGHHPNYMWIGCSDARVPANEVMGEDAGSVFVVRNVANMVVNTDFNLMSALQYAVTVLKVPHIIVCGHYDCGGVRASMEAKDHVPPLENWLRNIRDVYRLHRVELDAIDDPEERHRRLVELNVIEQCLNIFKTGVVQRTRVESYKDKAHNFPYTTPRIHAAVFNPKTGTMTPLKVDFSEYIDDLHEIYDLYSVEEKVEDKEAAAKAAEFSEHLQIHSVRLVAMWHEYFGDSPTTTTAATATTKVLSDEPVAIAK
eukprot:CAMPEP_0118719336 /NCGR_PEP_ID=MMETSP0800-20121206/29413_1 /TAXON_ID=210618 ORGANISM="Striatella unipunctata, Strain CCMP2910" /NCGR_SAMPLE_ID=MMETSP0800 /ASSEMBLY_ACC=CAM_ASM_000638 /LENGTH=350 /DNA_ID=CAMNT_0006626683 /DNA_START=1 /DNA_END=1053 /DNA_ORIENTATION=-